MKINSVVSFTNGRAYGINKLNSQIAFGQLEKKDKPAYKDALERSYDYLGIDKRALIIHAPSFPASSKLGYDQMIGSAYMQKDFVDFITTHGFNAIQLGPMGQRPIGQNSPYMASVFEKDISTINLEALTSKEFANILSESDLKKIMTPIKAGEGNFVRVNYQQSEKIVEAGLTRAYSNFRRLLGKNDPAAQRLSTEFERFKKRKADWLDDYAVLHKIAEKYPNDYYPQWTDEKDKTIIQDVRNGDKAAIANYNRIAAKSDFYKFCQFIAHKQAQLTNKKGEVEYIGDLQVAQSSLDELVNKDIFLDDWCVGAPDGGPMKSPQLWGFPLVDPAKLFNQDGSLGPAGKYIRARVINALETNGNIRIDHVFGLVNPYVYNKNTVEYETRTDSDGNEFQCPNMAKLYAGRIINLDIEGKENFQRIIPEIIIPAMEEMGVEPRDAVWETLGAPDETGIFGRVFYDENHLVGISPLMWQKGQSAHDHNIDNWALIASHDGKRDKQLAQVAIDENRDSWDSYYLASRITNDPAEQGKIREEIVNDIDKRVLAKRVDLMRSCHKIEQHVFDFLGIDIAYNIPGTVGDKNWSGRLTPDYEDKYNEALKQGRAENIPQVLKLAIQGKMSEDIQNNPQDADKIRKEGEALIKELEYWEAKLVE